MTKKNLYAHCEKLENLNAGLSKALESIVVKMEQSANMSVAAKEHYGEAIRNGRQALEKATASKDHTQPNVSKSSML